MERSVYTHKFMHPITSHNCIYPASVSVAELSRWYLAVILILLLYAPLSKYVSNGELDGQSIDTKYCKVRVVYAEAGEVMEWGLSQDKVI